MVKVDPLLAKEGVTSPAPQSENEPTGHGPLDSIIDSSNRTPLAGAEQPLPWPGLCSHACWLVWLALTRRARRNGEAGL